MIPRGLPAIFLGGLLAGSLARSIEAAEAPAGSAGRWAFRPLSRPALPAARQAEWCRNGIDRFILSRLEAEGLRPSAPAGRLALIRRLSLDLLGLPPDPEEAMQFVNDESLGALERLVDRLLASPRYGERWGRHWLDVARFAETNGFETNTARPNAWPYRDYVIRAFNEDRPYPRFILEQLAGDAVGEDEATGFLVGGAYDTVKSPDRKLTLEQRANELHDMVATTGSAFLGLTVGCARCHDHKFDPIAQHDYYALAAVFSGVQHGERELPHPDREKRETEAVRVREELAAIDRRLWEFEPPANPEAKAGRVRAPVHPLRNVDRFDPITARRVRFTVLATNSAEPCLDELEVYTAEPVPRNVALASAGARPSASSEYPNSEIHRIAHLNDGRHGNGRSWISREPGKGWAEVELAEMAVIDRVIWGRDREGRYADRLAVEYRIEVEREPGRWMLVATSADRRPFKAGAKPEPPSGRPSSAGPDVDEFIASRAHLEEELRDLTRSRLVYAGTFGQPGATHRLQRGDPLDPREAVDPGAVAAASVPLALSGESSDRERRIALARWLGDPANPFTARVLVNRLWHYHFGRGLVPTPSDFGAMGARPTHPELLDWLACELIENRWSMKAIHRLIVLSSTYLQDGHLDAAGLAADADARLCWRFPGRRLEAEAIRDSVLQASGTLDLRMGGPGYEVFEPNDNYVRVYEPKTRFGPREWRRMVYQTKPRKEQDSTFGAFDCPDSSQSSPRREVSTNALQALNLLNSSFVIEQAAYFAERLRRETAGDDRAAVRRGFLIAFGREPDAAEEAAGRELAAAHGLPAFCRALFNANEFVYLP